MRKMGHGVVKVEGGRSDGKRKGESSMTWKGK